MAGYYETLGVTPQATEAELKKAFRTLAMQYHPDRNPGDKQAEDRFKEINEAYACLSDPDKRAHYDRFGTAPGTGSSSGFDAGFGSLFEDIFENFLGGSGRGRRTRAARGEDLQYELKITLEEAAAGLETKIQVPRLETCETCGGYRRRGGHAPGGVRRLRRPRRGADEPRLPHGGPPVPAVPGRGTDQQEPLQELPRRGAPAQRAPAVGQDPGRDRGRHADAPDRRGVGRSQRRARRRSSTS